MEYLSFDVGIKNLAYCCINGEDKSIKQWGIINLNENPLCDMTLKKKCDKQASYSFKNGNEISHYCSSHINHKSIVDMKGRKKKLNANYDLCKLSQTCITKLRKLDLSNVKYVLIENQPALKNPTMKSIQMIVYTYFIIEGLMNDHSSIEGVHMVNARNKLKVYKGEPIECDKKNKYAKNKFLSVEYTKLMILKDDEQFQELFQESKKKDDLADAYLQGIYWIEK
jgi:hypothetical protein